MTLTTSFLEIRAYLSLSMASHKHTATFMTLTTRFLEIRGYLNLSLANHRQAYRKMTRHWQPASSKFASSPFTTFVIAWARKEADLTSSVGFIRKRHWASSVLTFMQLSCNELAWMQTRLDLRMTCKSSFRIYTHMISAKRSATERPQIRNCVPDMAQDTHQPWRLNKQPLLDAIATRVLDFLDIVHGTLYKKTSLADRTSST